MGDPTAEDAMQEEIAQLKWEMAELQAAVDVRDKLLEAALEAVAEIEEAVDVIQRFGMYHPRATDVARAIDAIRAALGRVKR